MPLARVIEHVLTGDEVLRRIYGGGGLVVHDLARQRIDAAQPLDGVAKGVDSQRLLLVTGPQLNNVTAHAKTAALKVRRGARVVDVHQAAQEVAAIQLFARSQQNQTSPVLVRISQPVDGTDTGHDNHIPTRQQTAGGPQTQTINLVVDRSIFLDVGVACWQVGLGLIVVIVADEELDRVAWKETRQFAIQLRGQGFIVREHQRRTLHTLNQLRNGIGFSAAGYAQQNLFGAMAQPFNQRVNRRPLVTHGLKIANQSELLGHLSLLLPNSLNFMKIRKKPEVSKRSIDPLD